MSCSFGPIYWIGIILLVDYFVEAILLYIFINPINTFIIRINKFQGNELFNIYFYEFFMLTGNVPNVYGQSNSFYGNFNQK